MVRNFAHDIFKMAGKNWVYRFIQAHEKGLLLGILQKAKRVFTQAYFESGKLLGAGQDGNREWITILATICMDGSYLSPTRPSQAIYKIPGLMGLIHRRMRLSLHRRLRTGSFLQSQAGLAITTSYTDNTIAG